MNYFFIIFFSLLCICGCSSDDPAHFIDKDDPVQKEDPSDPEEPDSEDNPDDKDDPVNPEEALIQQSLVQMGIKPSRTDSIQKLIGYIKEKEYGLLLGIRNHRAWLSKFDASGNELFYYDLFPGKGWKYSFFQQGSLVWKDEKYLFVKGWFVNTPDANLSQPYDECLCIIDLHTGKEIDRLDLIYGYHNYYYTTEIQKISDRYLVRRQTSFYSVSAQQKKYDHFHVVNPEGKVAYGREWQEDKEGDFFSRNPFLFFDDERIVTAPENEFLSYKELKIINLKTWKLLKSYTSENGFFPQGDRVGEAHIVYLADTTYAQGNYVRFVYTEEYAVTKEDEITGAAHTTYTLLDKYCFDINMDDYSLTHRKLSK